MFPLSAHRDVMYSRCTASPSPPCPVCSGDGSVCRSAPYGLVGAAGQWEPTLAALLLRQSPGTDGARLGWDLGQGRVPAMNSRWFTPRLRTEGRGAGGGAPSAQLTPAGCRVIHREGGEEVGTTNGCLRKGGLVIPWDFILWSAVGSVQHVCRESSLLNTFHLKPPLGTTIVTFTVSGKAL